MLQDTPPIDSAAPVDSEDQDVATLRLNQQVSAHSDAILAHVVAATAQHTAKSLRKMHLQKMLRRRTLTIHTTQDSDHSEQDAVALAPVVAALAHAVADLAHAMADSVLSTANKLRRTHPQKTQTRRRHQLMDHSDSTMASMADVVLHGKAPTIRLLMRI